jgi:hypothetical protein
MGQGPAVCLKECVANGIAILADDNAEDLSCPASGPPCVALVGGPRPHAYPASSRVQAVLPILQ